MNQCNNTSPFLDYMDINANSYGGVWKALTVIVSFDCADQAEELNYPTEALLHLKHKHTCQDLKHAERERIRCVAFLRTPQTVRPGHNGSNEANFSLSS